MAGKDLKYSLKMDASDAKKALADTASAADDTRTKAQKLADAINSLADDADADFADMKSASSSMATALGEDFVRARTEAGGSVDMIVQGLRELGLSFDEIRGDADQLADAVKRMDDSKTAISNLGTAARGTSMDLDKVRGAGDNSRSVLANMVGNSVQDMGALGGVAGTAGMALGQLGEYAAEGNIKLSGLAKVAGPMAALGAVTWAVQSNIKATADRTKDLNEAFTDLLGLSEQGLADTFHQMLARMLLDGKALDEQFGDLADTNLAGAKYMLDNAEAVGLNAEQTVLLTTAIAEQAAEEARRTENTKKYGDAADDAAAATENHESKLRTFSDAANEARIATDEVEEATRNLTAAYDEFTGRLDAEDAFADFQEKMFVYRSEVEHSDQATRDYTRALGETIMALDNIPEETKTQMIALLDAGNIDAIESRLNFVARDRVISISGQLVGSDLRNAMEPRAAGGPVRAGSSYLVGERGPEVVTMGGRGHVTPNSALGGDTHFHLEGAVIASQLDFERMVNTALLKSRQRGSRV